METITRSQIRKLVERLPATKLSLAYGFLLELVDNATEELSPQAGFMRLPLDERRRIMAQQAQELVSHYEQIAEERQEWQVGDFVDEY